MSQAPPPTPGGSPAGAPSRDTDGVVRVEHLTKTFGSGPTAVHAVHDLSFEVHPGRVTGFLGPNGAGKTTTLRMLLGLVTPTRGQATIGGRRYDQIERPAHVVGAALEAASFHPGRTARDHLRVYAPQVGVSDARADEVLALVGLADVAKRRVGGFSLGMRQRLALATTLLGDPPVLLLDEPANGLDPEGIAWLRGFLRALAREGRTVLVSSHVLSEVEQTVDDVVIIARGQLVHASSLPDLARLARPRVSVVSPDAAALDALVATEGWTVAASGRDGDAASYELLDVDPARVGAAAFARRVELHRLTGHDVGLEDLFLQLTAGPAQAGQADQVPAQPAQPPAQPPAPPSPQGGAAPQTDTPAGGQR